MSKKAPGVLIAPSILSADFSELSRDVRVVERAGADWLHIDVMDGHFVPNITIGPGVVKCLRPRTKMLFDAHLMIDRPDRYWKQFQAAGSDLITFHAEARVDRNTLIRDMKKAGLKVGISVRPRTPFSRVAELLPLLDLILVMTVEPGFGGQQFMPGMLRKVRQAREAIDRRPLPCRLQVDGGINSETCRPVLEAGADVLVAGNLIFGDKNPAAAVRRLRGIIDKMS